MGCVDLPGGRATSPERRRCSPPTAGICLPSTAGKEGETSRIVTSFPSGTCVTTPRHQVDVIITEHGAAELAGLTNQQRRETLIGIAHPKFRDELAKSL